MEKYVNFTKKYAVALVFLLIPALAYGQHGKESIAKNRYKPVPDTTNVSRQNGRCYTYNGLNYIANGTYLVNVPKGNPITGAASDADSLNGYEGDAYAYKNGWPEQAGIGVTLSIRNSNRYFKVADGGDDYYYCKGVKYVLAGDDSVQITDTEGLWFIYYDDATLKASQTPWSITADTLAFVAYVYWDADNDSTIGVGYELHGYTMDAATHARMHDTQGTLWEDGLQVADAGSETVNVSAGHIHDEDIEMSITDGIGSGLWDQTLSPAELPIYYLDGAGVWRRFGVTDKANATDVGYVDGSNDLKYNRFSTTFDLATVGINNFVAYYVVATNDLDEPIILFMGQSVDNTLADAQENQNFGALYVPNMPNQEFYLLARLILRDTGSGVYYTLEEVLDLRTAYSGGNIAPLATDHGVLTGLGDQIDHQWALTIDGTRALTANWDAGAFEIKTDDLVVDDSLNVNATGIVYSPTNGWTDFAGKVKIQSDGNFKAQDMTQFINYGSGSWASIGVQGINMTGSSTNPVYNEIVWGAHSYNHLTSDLVEGNAYRFLADAGVELTDTDAEQAFMNLTPRINQSATANYVGLLMDVTETATGSGTNELMALRVGGTDKFTVANNGNVDVGAFLIGDNGFTVSTGAGGTTPGMYIHSSQLSINNGTSNANIYIDLAAYAAGADGEIRLGDTGTAGEYTEVDSVGNVTIGADGTIDNLVHTFKISGDADSDIGETTSETLSIYLEQNATPGANWWKFDNTNGYGFQFNDQVGATRFNGPVTTSGTSYMSNIWLGYSSTDGIISSSDAADDLIMNVGAGASFKVYGNKGTGNIAEFINDNNDAVGDSSVTISQVGELNAPELSTGNPSFGVSGLVTLIASDNDQMAIAPDTDDKMQFTGASGGYFFNDGNVFHLSKTVFANGFYDDVYTGETGISLEMDMTINAKRDIFVLPKGNNFSIGTTTNTTSLLKVDGNKTTDNLLELVNDDDGVVGDSSLYVDKFGDLYGQDATFLTATLGSDAENVSGQVNWIAKDGDASIDSMGTDDARYFTGASGGYKFDDTIKTSRLHFGTGTYPYIEQYSTTGGLFLKLGYGRTTFQTNADNSVYSEMFVFSSNGGAGELTATNSEQSWLTLYPYINQTSTANYIGLLMDVTEVSTGSGTNELMALRVGGTDKFTVANNGDMMISGDVRVESDSVFLQRRLIIGTPEQWVNEDGEIIIYADRDADAGEESQDTLHLYLQASVNPYNAKWNLDIARAPLYLNVDDIYMNGEVNALEDVVVTGNLAVNGDTLTSDGDLAIIPSGGDVNISANINEYKELTCGTTLAAGDLCYMDPTDWEMKKVDADAEATSIGLLAIATESGTDGNAATFLIRGYYTTSGLSTANLFVSTTEGEWTGTAPSGAGDVVRVIGHPISATVFHFDPDGAWGKI